MAETVTPAVCGGRVRTAVAAICFALGAVAAAFAVGAAAGLLGEALPRGAALAVAVAVAALGALRELRLLRVPLPQRRRQVPEHWRRSWPLPLWSGAYGAGLGAGALTHVPFATWYAALAGAVVIGDPLVSGLCLALFGAGRALAAVALGPRSLERVVAAAGPVRRLNAAALGSLAALLLLAPAAGAAVVPLGPGSYSEPSASGGVLAYAEASGAGGTAVVRAGGKEVLRVEGAWAPSLDGDYLAFADVAGVRVIRWRTGEDIARIEPPASRPALDFPRLVYRAATRAGPTADPARPDHRREAHARVGRPGRRSGAPGLRGRARGLGRDDRHSTAA